MLGQAGGAGEWPGNGNGPAARHCGPPDRARPFSGDGLGAIGPWATRFRARAGAWLSQRGNRRHCPRKAHGTPKKRRIERSECLPLPTRGQPAAAQCLAHGRDPPGEGIA